MGDVLQNSDHSPHLCIVPIHRCGNKVRAHDRKTAMRLVVILQTVCCETSVISCVSARGFIRNSTLIRDFMHYGQRYQRRMQVRLSRYFWNLRDRIHLTDFNASFFNLSRWHASLFSIKKINLLHDAKIYIFFTLCGEIFYINMYDL